MNTNFLFILSKVCWWLVFLFVEEICTLVIAEAFPEDGGLFCCTASNPYGSINSTAHLTVTAGESRWVEANMLAP